MNELLKNNHQGMKTVVETFIIEETAELIYDNEQLDKWNELVSELGLTGQTQIVKKDKSPIPFMHLKATMKAVFETLCPRKVDVAEYNVTPIPVEILDLIALSKREGYFDKLQIWYDDKTPDPVCIGLKCQWYSYNSAGSLDTSFPTKQQAIDDMVANGIEREPYCIEWSGEFYLLGKWADVKHSFEQLIEMATKRFISQKGNEYRKTIKESQRKLDDLEIEASETFGGKNSALALDLPF